MIISVLTLTFVDGKSQDGLAAVHKSLSNTRGFAGCLGVEVAQNVADPHSITVIERWESVAHDQAYRQWAASQGAPSPLAGLIGGPPRLSVGTLLTDV